MLWKLKSAKRKTTKKQNVLIAFNKGIASAQGIELAMLFSHAGFDVKSIFFEGAEEYVSAAAIKDITEHSPWSATHKPGWLKADFKFETGIVINPIPGVGDLGLEADGNSTVITSSDEHSEFCDNTKRFFDCIFSRCLSVKLLTVKDNIEKFSRLPDNCEVIALPDNLLKLHEVFEQLLADVVKLTSSKALNSGITYSFNGDINNIEYIKDLETAFKEYGIEATQTAGAGEASAEPNARIIINQGNKAIKIALEYDGDKQPDKGLIYINKHKNGLVLTDSIETRLLPDFSCKSCFSKFVEYLREEMDRE